MIVNLAKLVIELSVEKGFLLATAESCTGGLIAGALTGVAGSSAVVDRGFVTYSNEAKTEMLGVPADLIATKGAVSDVVARAMVAGALAQSRAQTAVAVTGVAGPGGGTEEKPVGLVHIAVQSQDGIATINEFRFADLGAKSRDDVRQMTVNAALEMILSEIK